VFLLQVYLTQVNSILFFNSVIIEFGCFNLCLTGLLSCRRDIKLPPYQSEHKVNKTQMLCKLYIPRCNLAFVRGAVLIEPCLPVFYSFKFKESNYEFSSTSCSLPYFSISLNLCQSGFASFSLSYAVYVP